MTTSAPLHELLPAIYDLRDSERQGALAALLDVLDRQRDAMEGDIDRLYDDWFIETCSPWVVAYIGDLLDVRALHESEGISPSRRAYVANTIHYRRRKGTIAVLQKLAHDVTGWRTLAVEFFRTLATTQHLGHLRAEARTLDFREPQGLELIGGPFDRAAHNADVRSVELGRGQHNIPNVGLFLWRLQSYPVSGVTARHVGSESQPRYTFDPAGLDAPLFARPRTLLDESNVADESDFPDRLRRRALDRELADRAGADPAPARWFTEGDPVFTVRVQQTPEDDPEVVTADELAICDLSDWRELSGVAKVGVDPVLGRVHVAGTVLPHRVIVDYGYGFAADVGAGPYDRTRYLEELFEELGRPALHVGVSTRPEDLATGTADAPIVSSLRDAVGEWKNFVAAGRTGFGLVSIMDSASYTEDLTGARRIELPEGSTLAIVAAHWPANPDGTRTRGAFAASGVRPHLRGAVSVIGTAAGPGADAGSLVIDGLLVEGAVTVRPGHLRRLHLSHLTLVPGGPSLVALANQSGANERLEVSLFRCRSGGIRLAESIFDLSIVDSIVDNAGDGAISAPGTSVSIESCTVLGSTETRRLEASNVIFDGKLEVRLHQQGCVRFSYVAPVEGTSSPRRHRCQPDLALEKITGTSRRALVRARVKPSFTSEEPADPAYAQLSTHCAPEISMGAEDGAEMGVFRHLQQPQRAANLRVALDEYLRWGLEAGVFYVT